MPSRHTLLSVAAFAIAAASCGAVAWVGAHRIEDRTRMAVSRAMALEGLDWVDIRTDGLEVHLAGTAPTEAERFQALAQAGNVVDGDRIVDNLAVVETRALAPPRFSLEMLRNGEAISLIGLVPDSGRAGAGRVVDDLREAIGGAEISDMVEVADFPVPRQWPASVDFGISAIADLSRSQISVFDGMVEITAIADSAAERAALGRRIAAALPEGIDMVLDISAPRPVITPFLLRYVLRDGSGRFEACAADTAEAARRILAAARAAGGPHEQTCRVGIGAPSPSWAEAIVQSLAALGAMGAGTLSVSDADITLTAGEAVDQAEFDRVVGELENALPGLFSLRGRTPEREDGDAEEDGPPQFITTLSPEGYVQLRGRLPDARVTEAVRSYAMAVFGGEDFYLATRTDPNLPEGWPVRVLAGLEALGHLENGSLVVEPDSLRVRGNTGSRETEALVAALLSEELDGAPFDIGITYQQTLDETLALPTPQECVRRINDAIDRRGGITFDPGSTEINAQAGEVLDAIAEILPDCARVRIEIAAHSDNQGREEMNLRLSQTRAEAVLSGLLARGVSVRNLTAQGYGESQPIADNATEAGREANRRVAFTLLAGGVPARDRVPPDAAADPAPDPGGAAQPGVAVEVRPASAYDYDVRPMPRPDRQGQ